MVAGNVKARLEFGAKSSRIGSGFCFAFSQVRSFVSDVHSTGGRGQVGQWRFRHAAVLSRTGILALQRIWRSEDDRISYLAGFRLCVSHAGRRCNGHARRAGAGGWAGACGARGARLWAWLGSRWMGPLSPHGTPGVRLWSAALCLWRAALWLWRPALWLWISSAAAALLVAHGPVGSFGAGVPLERFKRSGSRFTQRKRVHSDKENEHPVQYERMLLWWSEFGPPPSHDVGSGCQIHKLQQKHNGQ